MALCFRLRFRVNGIFFQLVTLIVKVKAMPTAVGLGVWSDPTALSRDLQS